MVVAVCSAAIYACTWFMSAWWHLVVPLAAALLGNLAPVLVGPVLVGPNHDFAGDAAIVLTCLTAAFGGSTVVLFLRQARAREISSIALHRWARLGSAGVPAMICAELVIVWFKLAGTSPVGGLTGALSIARLTCLAILGAAVLATRRAEARGGLDGRWLSLGAFAVLAGVGAEAAMTRFLSPQFLVETSISQVYLGFDLPDPPSFSTLTTDLRPNLLFMVIAGTASFAYARGFATLRRRGDLWPAQRAVAFFAGCAVLVVSTSSGVGRYAGADFAVHMGMHMALNMLAPILLVLGGPVTLALTSLRPSKPPGAREWIAAAIDAPIARAIYHPVVVLVVFVGSYYVLYLTPLFELMSRDHWAHQLMNLHFVVIGFMYYGLIIGVDRTPYRLPHVARLGYVFAAMPFHAFFGVIVMSSKNVIADGFYTHLAPSWAGDLLATQYIGGGIAWAGGEIPLVIVVIVLVAQWRASDEREARRKDRHLDTGRDDEFETYNRMLRQLAERDDRAPRQITEMAHDDR
jgi:putative copper resistance protein D